MRKILLVMRQEIRKVLRSTAYLVFGIFLPVVLVLALGVIKLIQQDRAVSAGGQMASVPVEFEMAIEGYVDQSGLIDLIPGNLPEGSLIAYANEAQAQQALQSGAITAYYVIPADYIQSGEIYYVYPDERSYLSDGQQWVMEWTLTVNILAGDMDLADRVWSPIWNSQDFNITPQLEAQTSGGEDCSRPGTACESNEFVRMMPSIVVAVLYAAFMASSSMLFNSIGTEKENRTIEVLLLSLSPRQLLAGKTLGLSIVGLIQTAVWLGAVFISFNMGSAVLRLPENFTFPASILIWGLVFFFGGYGLYASLMAGAGALVPKMKESGMASFLPMFPLFIGYALGMITPFTDTTQSGLMIALSIFPLTAPAVMVMRLTDGLVPWWQLWLSAGLTYATAYFTLHAVAAMFHAQNLLSGESFSAGRYVKALFGRV